MNMIRIWQVTVEVANGGETIRTIHDVVSSNLASAMDAATEVTRQRYDGRAEVVGIKTTDNQSLLIAGDICSQ